MSLPKRLTRAGAGARERAGPYIWEEMRGKEVDMSVWGEGSREGDALLPEATCSYIGSAEKPPSERACKIF